MPQPTLDEWSGENVSVAQIEHELARLRGSSGGEDRSPRQRTSVMTHVVWVPPEWLDAAERTLEGLAAQHPSRTVLLVPEASEQGGIDAELSVRCFATGDREVCGEVIELHLRGDRALAPASLVVPLAIADLPVFLRWRGMPAFASSQSEQLIELADRAIVDSSEWEELRYAELAAVFGQTAVSDIAWSRIYPWRVALADQWPELRTQEIFIRGPRAETTLLRFWLSERLEREPPAVEDAAALAVILDGNELTIARERPRSPSDLLSAELDHFGRDPIYEQAVLVAVASGSLARAS